jgi:hypothetical protein
MRMLKRYDQAYFPSLVFNTIVNSIGLQKKLQSPRSIYTKKKLGGGILAANTGDAMATMLHKERKAFPIRGFGVQVTHLRRMWILSSGNGLI